MKEKMDQQFIDTMVKNMWDFINPDMIHYMIGAKIKYKETIADNRFTPSFRNTICYKGSENSGHYVYVDNNLIANGTWENDLIYLDVDDGICHGAAMAYYCNANNILGGDFTLRNNPRIQNYKSIMRLYINLIDTGLWDQALSIYFPDKVKWEKGTTKQTKKAYECLIDWMNTH